MIKIGKRPLSEVINRVFRKELLGIIKNFFLVHKSPIKAMYEEFFTKGKYPKIIETNQGIKIKLFSYGDFSTFNLVFCRQDYLADEKINVVLDIGSNIGITAHYWFFKNPKVKVYCFEPSQKNFKRLSENTKKFKKRIKIQKCAVSNFNGYSKLYRSETGVNDSIVEKVSKNFDKVKVVMINSILEKIFREFKTLDVLKIDTEGCEREILKSINKRYFKKIRIINVEGNDFNNLIPKYFQYSFNASASRFKNKFL
tara:strand:+ start:301 stop:1065 length:765 start_codon:yes stop_codon:yes gene_type:complete